MIGGVCVTAIASNGRFFHFEPQDRITLIYRSSEVMWMWDHVESGLAKLDGYPVHYFQIKDKGRTFNRRNAYRVNLLKKFSLDIILIRIPDCAIRMFR